MFYADLQVGDDEHLRLAQVRAQVVEVQAGVEGDDAFASVLMLICRCTSTVISTCKSMGNR